MTEEPSPPNPTSPPLEPRDKRLVFTLVGHAHIDPVWLWNWQEGYETVKATFRSALDRLAENPDMVFAHSSTAQYAWMEDHPELLEEIRQAVARGQWEPVGGFWVEPDVNIPGGEALVRQGLYGQRELERLVGRRAKIAFLPDSFGHPATLPQIFRGLGLEAFVFMRPGANEIELPSNLFDWEGPDGSKVLALRVECYNTNPLFIDSSLERNLYWRPGHLSEWVGLFGVGNHGGGPTKKAIASIRKLNEDPRWPTLRLGSLEGFFQRMESRERPLYRGELQHHARGCYSAFSEIKRLNRRAEEALLTAEKLAVMAGAYGFAYPHDELERAWKRLLFNQFHDILAGSSIASAYSDSRNELGEALAIAHRVSFRAIQQVAARVDTRLAGADAESPIRFTRWDGRAWVTDYGDGVPVLVFNPSPHPRHEALEVEINDWHTPDVRVLDEAGNPVYHQNVAPESASGGRPRVLFNVELPPLGYRLYRIVDQAPAALPAEAPLLEAGFTPAPGAPSPVPFLENDWWRLELDPTTGALKSLYDKGRGLELLAGAGAHLLVMHDPTDTWGHGITHLRHLGGVFEPVRLELIEAGPVRATLQVEYRYSRSGALQKISLYRETPQLEGEVTVNWQETHKALQLSFPFALSDPEATFAVPYGHAVRPADGQEEPVQGWLDVSGTVRDRRGVRHRAGVALLNDSKHSASALGGEARLTLLRSPVFGHHDPARLEPGVRYSYQDQGVQRFRWGLVPHGGDWREAGVVRKAHDLNTALPFVREYVHAGEAPPVQSFVRLEHPGALCLSALKVAENGDGLIIRLFEPHGRAVRSRLEVLGKRFEVEAGPYQIKTYRIGAEGVQAVNLLEE